MNFHCCFLPVPGQHEGTVRQGGADTPLHAACHLAPADRPALGVRKAIPETRADSSLTPGTQGGGDCHSQRRALFKAASLGTAP